MTISKTKSFAEILSDPNSRIGRLIGKARELEKLTGLFRATLDTELAKHCTVGNFDGTQLSLVAESASWATQLRFSIPDIIKTLKVQPEFKNLSKIRVRVGS